MKKSTITFALISMSLLGSTFSTQAADNAKAEKLYQEAITAYEGRSDLKNVDSALTKIEEALKNAEASELKYDILILKARALYFKGAQATNDKDRMEIHESGYTAAEQAKKIDDSYAEGYYYFGTNLGRWAEAKGVLASLGRKKELIESAEGASERVTRSGDSGETLDSYGPARVLGRIYFKLPSWAGGDNEKSLDYLKTAYENGMDNALNAVYYAETLAAGSSDQKKKAKSILDELLKNDPNTLNPARVPETIEEFEIAKKLRKQLG